jgi:LacI family gluconate utilization system Gnt-I transcriptional repressor
MSKKPEAERGRDPALKVGVREIAKSAGVAPMTVSRVLSNPEMVKPETRARVQEAIDKFGFVPNRLASSIRGNGRIVGTVVPALINAGIAEQVQGMSDECQSSGYSMMLAQGEFTAAAEESAIRTILGWRPAGLILQSFVQSPAARALLLSNNVPIVEISEVRGNSPLGAAVGISNFDAAFAMTTHLAGKGYRHIGFVSMPVHGNDRLQQRRAGYKAAMRQLGMEDSTDMEVQVPISARGGADALVTLTDRRPEIDVIFFSSDSLALGAIQECHRRGWKVPKRIGIAGYGDLEFAAELFPTLTTVRVDRYQMGREAVRHLVARLNGKRDMPTITSLGFQIIDRQSA